MRVAFVLFSTLLMTAAAEAASHDAADKAPGFHIEPDSPATIKALAEKPVTKVSGPVGDLLRKWYAEKTAAGNVGDVYDNRDRGHSGLDLGQFPQLSKTVYNELALKYRLDWAGTLRRLPIVVFGNSSTSAGVSDGGSNPRMMYTRPGGLRALNEQYASNNLYIYPEHCDYKPGHNGTPGYGDLYPTNTPFVFISQGSSGSDQPFMRAVPLTMAAFRPEVKQKLVADGLLMPTVQMIFRWSATQLSGSQDYLAGKAHPPVFEGSWVDPLAMVRMAHEMTAEAIPPLVKLTVVEEETPVRGCDYFEREGLSEVLGTTPAVIARFWRGRDFTRRMMVSAGTSIDANQRPLEFHWKLLRGDPAKVTIKPLTSRRAGAEIVVHWHDRYPIVTGSPMESNRVDIGVFAFNGVHYSAPAFITFFFLDSEARTYDAQGRLLEIGYGAGDVDVQASDLSAVLEAYKPGSALAGGDALRAAYSPEQTKAILAAAEPYRRSRAAWRAAVKNREEAEKAHKPDKEIRGLRDTESAAEKAQQQVLDGGQDLLHMGVGKAVLAPLRSMAADPYLFRGSGKIAAEVLRTPAQKAAFRRLSERFVRWGLFREAADSPEKLALAPVRKEADRDPAALTRFEKDLLRRFHGEWLGQFVYRDLASFAFRAYYVDPNISPPKSWRDVYHYDAKGACAGWTRYSDDATAEFAADGKLITEKDATGVPRKTQAVSYEQEQRKFDPANPPRGPNRNPLRWKAEL